MVWNAADIRTGMDVFGLDGRLIGSVVEVWLEVAEPRDLDAGSLGHSAAHGLMPLGDVSGAVTATDGYFSLESADQSEPSWRLFIPFSAVQILFPGQNVTLACSSEECRKKYGRVPREVDRAATASFISTG
jgi:hypothetical protein